MSASQVSPLALVFTLCASGCASHPYVSVNGTASFTTTPPSAGSSGALPLQAVACAGPGGTSIHLGDRCTLSGRWVSAGRVRGGTVRLTSSGPCLLPGPNGQVIPIQVTSALLQSFGDAIETTVGGLTTDRQYITYRFTGTGNGDVPEEACADVSTPPPPPVVDATTEVAPGKQAWESFEPEPVVK